MATSALPTETNTAPPAALLPPGLQDDDDEDAMLLLKLQLKNVKLEDRVTAEDVVEDLGYAYDSNDAETAPPTETASFEKPDVDELLLQCAHDVLKSSMLHDEMNKPETALEPPLLYEYAPTATDIPPPYALAPEEEEEREERPDVNDDAVQLVSVLLEMV